MYNISVLFYNYFCDNIFHQFLYLTLLYNLSTIIQKFLSIFKNMNDATRTTTSKLYKLPFFSAHFGTFVAVLSSGRYMTVTIYNVIRTATNSLKSYT